ncbi:hypothetical protein FRC00_001876 [Tulasnella sp. 408]|nr:hypothetical protein FRC00_001876 [Tulasnella sp. 408]
MAASQSVIGGAVAVCEYLLFLAVGLAFLQKHIIIPGLPLQSELEVVPVPVGPIGPVVECQVPDTRTPVLPATPPRRPLVRRPLLNSSTSRLGGPRNKIEPQPVTTPVRPSRPGRWIERMSVEGKLVLYSDHTGPDGSLEWTVQFFPRREHWYYLSEYPASPSLNPLLEHLLTFRPFVGKIPGAIMKEICDYIFSTSVVQPEADATSAPLQVPPSKSETPNAHTSTGMREPPTIFSAILPDSVSQALVASSVLDAVKANTNLVDAKVVHIPHPIPPQKPKPSSSLRLCRAKPTKAFPRSLPQHIHSAGRPSIATQHLSVTCITAPEPPLSPEQAAEILLNLQAPLANGAGRVQQHHALRHVADSGMELEKEDGANIAEAANPVGEDDIAGEDRITEEAQFNFRRGGKINTASKQRLQIQDGIMRRGDITQKDTVDMGIDWVKANSVPPADHLILVNSRATIATQPLDVTCNTVPAPQLIDVMEEVNIKLRYGESGEKRNTARKHGRQLQGEEQGDPKPGPSSAN